MSMHHGNVAFQTDLRNLLRIAVPISLGSLVQFLVVLTDNFFSDSLYVWYKYWTTSSLPDCMAKFKTIST